MKTTEMPEGPDQDGDDDFASFDQSEGPVTPPPVERKRRRRAEPDPAAPRVEPPATQEEAAIEAARREQAQRDLDAQPWFQKLAAKPTQTWHVRRDGPAKWKGQRVQTGISREPIRGKLTIGKVTALMGGGCMSVTSDDPLGPSPPTWYPLEELLGTPINFDALDEGGGSASIDEELKNLGAEMGLSGALADPEVEVYDPILKETIKVRKSLAADVQRKNQPAPPASDAKLLDFLREQREQQKEQRETNAAILRTLTALLEKPAAPLVPAVPVLSGDNPYKDMLTLEQTRNDRALADLRAQILAMQNQPRQAGPSADPMAMIGTILGAAKDLAGLTSGAAGSTALSAIDKIVGRTADALATVWPSVAGPFNAALWNIAWTAPFGGLAPQGGIPTQPGAQQIAGPPAAPVAPTAPAAPGVAVTSTPQEQERMFKGIREAVEKIGLMLDGKITPEDAWATIRVLAPPAVLAQIQALTSPAEVEVAISKLAMMPFLADRRDVLLVQAKRATGDARAIAEKFIAVARKP